MRKPFLIELIIWTFVLTFLFSGVIFGYSKIFIEPNIYTIYFKDIDGITQGSPVRFMGMNIGYVRKLTSKKDNIEVRFLVTKKDMKIPNGTCARVEFYGLGGSKSIELMPPSSDINTINGFVTSKNIRINDVVKEVVGFVQVLESIEKYVKTLDKAGLENFFQKVGEFKSDEIVQVGKDISDMNQKFHKKSKELKTKQSDIKQYIQNANKTIEKFNKFIKK